MDESMSYHPYRGKRGRRRRRAANWKIILLAVILLAAVCFAVPFGAVLGGAHDRIEGRPGAVIVLGCQTRVDGPSVLLKDRLDKALDYWRAHPDVLIVTSGAQGDNEPTTEARAMADYLMENGVPEEQILLEDRSFSTVQNLRNSLAVLAEAGYDPDGDVAVVSNAFHMTRVRLLWGRMYGGQGRLSTLAAPSSHVATRLKMYVREPLALVKAYFFD